MAQFYAIMTNLGTALMANAALNGTKINVTHFALGDGGGSFYLPAETMTELRNEVWRTAVSHGEISPESPNRMDFFAVVPPEVGGFTIREMGLFDAQNRLIGVANTPDIQKVAFADGVSYDSLLSISLAVVSPETLEYKVDPYVIIATKKDIELHNTSGTAHEDIRGIISGHMLDKTNKHAVTAAQVGAYTKAEADSLLSNKANKSGAVVFEMILPSGYQPHTSFSCWYWKNALNEVGVIFQISKISGYFPINTGLIIGTLPKGFCPLKPVFSPCMLISASQYFINMAAITPDGNVQVSISGNNTNITRVAMDTIFLTI